MSMMTQDTSTAPTTAPEWVVARVYRLPIAADFLATVPANGGRVLVVGKKTRPRSDSSLSFFAHMALEYAAMVPPATRWVDLELGLGRAGEDLTPVLRALQLVVDNVVSRRGHGVPTLAQESVAG